MTTAVTVTTITPLEDPTRGWCVPCGLPSALSWLIAFEANGHLLNGALTRFTICTDCGAESWDG